MLNIHKINPMVRAIGTMGAIAAVVGGVTFAVVTSNDVVLADNTVSTATASLLVGNSSTSNLSNCSGAGTSVSGMTVNNLVPGTPSAPFGFCIDNTGNTPLALTVEVNGSDPSGSLSSSDVTLNFSCGSNGAADSTSVNFSATVASLVGTPTNFGPNPLNNGTNDIDTCNVTATLAPGTYSSNESLNPFNLVFSGTSGS